MSKKVLSLSALALSFSLLQTPAAFAGHNEMRCFSGDGVVQMHKLMEKINLTNDQKTKIKAICDKAKEDIKAKRDELRAVHMKVNDAFKSNQMTDSTMNDFVDQEQQIIGSIIKIRMTERMDISNILTDDQKTKLADMITKWKAEHQDKDVD